MLRAPTRLMPKKLPGTIDEVLYFVQRIAVQAVAELQTLIGATAVQIAGGLIETGNGSLRVGSGVPADSMGLDGDFYFRTDGGAGTAIYQRRTGAWVAVA